MSFLFGGGRPTQSNTLKSYASEIRKHIRSMQREETKSTQSEKNIIKEIKALANKQEINMAKIKAKELVRTRTFRKRLAITQQGLSCLAQELSIMQSSQQTQEILEKTTKILHALNSKMDIGSTYKMLMEFDRQNTTMAEKQEIVDDSLDSMFDTDDSEIDSTMSSVFEELGLGISNGLSHKVTNLSTDHDMDVETRFARLVATQQR